MISAEAQERIDDLEQALRQRTQDLEAQKQCLEDASSQLRTLHTQLLQADKMASIGQLAAGVAHEINNPIGFISSNLNSLRHYIDDLNRVIGSQEALLTRCLQEQSDIRPLAEAIQRTREEVDLDYVIKDLGDLITESEEGAQRVRQIVADLKDFSHVDNPDVAEEDINLLLDKTINVVWNELKYKTQVVKVYGQLRAIPCYGGKLGQVFLNLLVNAAQSIATKGTITIRTGQTETHVWVEVEDTGCGIPSENMKRIFEPFFTTKGVGKGTGLGLHLAYTIVQAHGGRITVESMVGKGSLFRIDLPVIGPTAAKEERA